MLIQLQFAYCRNCRNNSWKSLVDWVRSVLYRSMSPLSVCSDPRSHDPAQNHKVSIRAHRVLNCSNELCWEGQAGSVHHGHRVSRFRVFRVHAGGAISYLSAKHYADLFWLTTVYGKPLWESYLAKSHCSYYILVSPMVLYYTIYILFSVARASCL